MKNEDFKKYSTIQLIEQITRLANEGGNTVLSISVRLVELEKRNVSHKLMAQGTYRRFRDIAGGKLSPMAAVAFAGENAILDGLTGLNIKEQDEIALGKTLPVAEADRAGKVVVRERMITELPRKQVSQVLSAGRIVPAAEQKKAVLVELKTAPIRKPPALIVTADKMTGTVIFSTYINHVKAEDLMSALRSLGYQLKQVA